MRIIYVRVLEPCVNNQPGLDNNKWCTIHSHCHSQSLLPDKCRNGSSDCSDCNV